MDGYPTLTTGGSYTDLCPGCCLEVRRKKPLPPSKSRVSALSDRTHRTKVHLRNLHPCFQLPSKLRSTKAQSAKTTPRTDSTPANPASNRPVRTQVSNRVDSTAAPFKSLMETA